MITARSGRRERGSNNQRVLAALHEAIEQEPVSRQVKLREMAFLLGDIDCKLKAISRDARDCNVVLARMVGKLQQFEATGGI